MHKLIQAHAPDFVAELAAAGGVDASAASSTRPSRLSRLSVPWVPLNP